MEVDLDKMADRVAEKALDEFTLNGKTLREWVEIIVAQDLLAISELEKVKAEIGGIKTEEGGDFLERPAIDIIYESQKILDKHISELKGESNEQKTET